MESKKSTNWIGTKNNPDLNTLEYLQRFYDTSKARYVCGQLEKGENGTPHIQFYINFHKPAKTLKHLQRSDEHCHYEICRVAGAAERYCLKEETRVEGPYEIGEKPVRRNEKADWEEVYALAKAGRIGEIPASIAIPHYRNLKTISGDFTVALEQPRDRGLWITGLPGVGKTHYVRHTYGDHVYWKAQNKWWDGYSGEAVACIDDLDSDCLGHYLKVWSHKWPCYGEIKGGRVALNYHTLVITSNFTIDDLFSKAPSVTVEAIRRRFRILHIKDPFQVHKMKDSHLEEERPRDDGE